MQVSFGSGTLVARATDANGVPTGTPQKFGVLQGASVDFAGNIKELFGQYQFPVAVARGTMKINGKASAANLNARLYNELFFNGTLTTGKERKLAINEAGSVGTTPFQITVAGAATFKRDYGVTDAATGVELIRVASAPATGQYSVNETTGVYTFASADTGKAVLLTYEYEPTITDGEIITINNQLLGVAPRFQVNLATLYDGKMFVLTLNACVSNKFSFGTKLEDFNIPDFEFSAFADNAGVVGQMSTRRA